jgi:hypothetical protein
VALLAMLVMACTQTPPGSNSATPSSSSSCRLPISIVDVNGILKGGAFVSYPNGKVTIDPGGAGGGYYDRAFSKRLPVNRNSVSSNEARYAYTERSLSVLGTDLAGRPIVGTSLNGGNGNDVTIWLASSPTEATEIGVLQAYYQAIADGHGVWFGGQQGIYLYSNAGALRKVSNQPGFPAGVCV